MLVDAEYRPAIGAAVPFKVGFERPGQVELDGAVHTTDYSIEYQSADITLKRDQIVWVKASGDSAYLQYKVRQTPQAKGDGTFIRAFLEKVSE